MGPDPKEITEKLYSGRIIQFNIVYFGSIKLAILYYFIQKNLLIKVFSKFH